VYTGRVLPPDASLRSLVTTYARLRAVLGETLGQPELIQPTGHHFPDAFAPDPAGIGRLFARMVSYSPLADDLPVELAFILPDGRAGGCGSSACGVSAGGRAGGGAVEDLGDRYRVSVPASEASHPVLLTTALARAIGALVLHEDGQESGAVTDATAEICAAQCGFGVLLTGGSEVWAKSCGGLKGTRATALSVEESATALALFTAVHAVEPSEARRHLQPTQRAAYEDACEWVDSNPFLVETLVRSPASLEHGTFDIEPQRGPLGRWLYRRRVERELRAPATKQKFAPSAAQQRYLAEARALVEGTFEEE
jgi:hypothetical protein